MFTPDVTDKVSQVEMSRDRSLTCVKEGDVLPWNVQEVRHLAGEMLDARALKVCISKLRVTEYNEA